MIRSPVLCNQMKRFFPSTLKNTTTSNSRISYVTSKLPNVLSLSCRRRVYPLPKIKRSRMITICSNEKTLVNDTRPCNEKSKHLILGGMFFCNLGVYTLIRDLKDVMLVTACGAESIPFMKTWVNFPLSISFMMIYAKLCNSALKQQHIYRIIYLGVFSLYMVLGYVLYPNRELLSPSLDVSSVKFIHKSVILIINNWIAALFFALSTIWGSTIVSLLFWLTANNYVKEENANVIYPLFGVLSNVSLIICGFLTKHSGKIHRFDWNMNVKSIMIIIFLFGSLNALLYEILVRNYDMVNMAEYKPKPKNNISVMDGLKNMLTTPFVMYMVILLACYGSAANLIDTVWKHNIHEYYKNPSDYSRFMGTVSSVKGTVSMVTMGISSLILKHIPYKITIMITPILLSCFGFVFFILNLNKPHPFVVVVFGSVIQIVVKSVKYAFFDPNKEIAFMSMNDDIKTKGKATIDLLSNSLGKSGISLLLQLLILSVGSITDLIPHLMMLFVLISSLWVRSAKKIGDIVQK